MKHLTAPLCAALAVLLSGCQTGDTPERTSEGASATASGGPQDAGPVEYAPLPASIVTPDHAQTRLGDLDFFDGLPSATTTQAVYDHLDFQRGVRAFLDAIPIASLDAMRKGLMEAGCVDGKVGIFESLMDSKTLFLTANTDTVYAMTWLDLSAGPVVVESPPNTLGFIDDAWFRHVIDLGNAGPDRGKGGKFLILPPDHDGPEPEGYFTARSGTYGNWLIWRGFLEDGDPGPAVANMKANIRIHRLAQVEDPPVQEFIDLSGEEFNTIHANDATFYDEVARVVRDEPSDGIDPEFLGLLASIGIEKGQPFAPDARMREILEDAAAVGNATARALVFDTRDPESYYYADSAWKTGFVGGSHEFLRAGARLLDARTLFFYYATGITPAMSAKMVGVGSQYAGAMVDSNGDPLDGARTYRLQLPPEVPAKDFWSLVLYDNQTRSMLQTDQRFPSLNSQGDVAKNADGSTTIFFGPQAPEGQESNWIQTVPGKGWSVILRLYGPLESWFEQTWRPGELDLLDDVAAAQPGAAARAMATEIPAAITTPDRVETRIGTLEFIDGFPTPATSALVYDNLDLLRGVEAFLNAMPAASILALREGMRSIGGGTNDSVVISESLLDARSLYLTANTESVYIGTFLDLSEGPLVVESPPNTLGMVNDMFFRYVADLGNAGPDRGQGGSFLFLPPDWTGEEPEGYFTFRSPTYSNMLFWRGFLTEGDPRPAIQSAKQTIEIRPLGEAPDPDRMRFVDASATPHNTIHSNDLSFFHEVAQVLDEEPVAAFSPELLGMLEGIGIRKGSSFAPDSAMQGVLTEAAAIGNATARALSFRPRDPRAVKYPDSAWLSPFVGGDHRYLRESGARDLDARVMYHYPYTAVTPAMVIERVGIGSQYGIAATDAESRYLDGAKSYSLTLPAGIPAKDFWSVVLYDPQTRSILQTPRSAKPSLSSQADDPESDADGSCTIWFGPKAPAGREANWIQTVPGKAWFVVLRIYGPLQPWFDQSWRPGEIVLQQD